LGALAFQLFFDEFNNPRLVLGTIKILVECFYGLALDQFLVALLAVCFVDAKVACPLFWVPVATMLAKLEPAAPKSP